MIPIEFDKEMCLQLSSQLNKQIALIDKIISTENSRIFKVKDKHTIHDLEDLQKHLKHIIQLLLSLKLLLINGLQDSPLKTDYLDSLNTHMENKLNALAYISLLLLRITMKEENK